MTIPAITIISIAPKFTLQQLAPLLPDELWSVFSQRQEIHREWFDLSSSTRELRAPCFLLRVNNLTARSLRWQLVAVGAIAQSFCSGVEWVVGDGGRPGSECRPVQIPLTFPDQSVYLLDTLLNQVMILQVDWWYYQFILDNLKARIIDNLSGILQCVQFMLIEF